MKKLLKEANVPWDESIIAVTSDKKSYENKFLDTLNNGYPLIILGILLFFYLGIILSIIFFAAVTSAILSPLMPSEIENSVFSVLSFMFFFVGIFSVISIIMGIRQLRRKGKWYVILYPDRILYKYRVNKEMYEQWVPLLKLQKCFIYPSQKSSYRLFFKRKMIKKTFFINVQFEYDELDTVHYIPMLLPNRYNDLNTIISYVQDAYHIPIYLTQRKIAKQETFQSIEDTHFQKVDFNGDLHAYIYNKRDGM